MTDQASTPTAAADDPDERLYDAYLDAALAGRIEAPDVFLARHPNAGTLLRTRLQALHGMLVETPSGTPTQTPSGGSGAAHTAVAADDVPYERLGEFRLLRLIDEGGMGAVYLAEQESLGRVVALKVIRPELHGSPTAAARFEREAQVVARLRHPNIVTAFAVGVDRGVHYLALEFVPGHGLDDVLAEAASSKTPIPPGRAVAWAAQIARALECAHAAGVVHRDVKPGNIRITPDGRPLLLDFGIAHDADALGLTRTTPVLGSPAYAAPEQVGSAGVVGPWTDVHGLGATLYECLSGRAPYLGRTVEETLHRVLVRQATPIRQINAAVSRDLETVLLHALEKDPTRRYPTAAAFADDLEALLEFRPIAARPPGRVRRTWQWMRRHPAIAAGSVVGALALVAAAGVSIARERAESERLASEARAAVAQAHEEIDRYRASRARTADLEAKVAELTEKQQTNYLTPEQDRFLSREEDAVELARREREEAFYDVLELLRRAERLDPDVEGVPGARAELYAEKWHEMRAAGETGAARLYRDLVARDDPTGTIIATVEGMAEAGIESTPPGAVAHLFRYRELSDVVEGGDRRLVPVAAGTGTSEVAPGTWALLIVEAPAAAGLHAGDLILELDDTPIQDHDPAAARAAVVAGGAVARVLTGGRLEQRTLAAGLVVRSTTQPLALDAGSRFAETPVNLKIPAGEYVVVLSLPGHEPTRTWFRVRPGYRATRSVTLLQDGATPRGFVRVPEDEVNAVPAFWIMEREVTVAEYLAYLNDPETLAQLEKQRPGDGAPVRIPRGAPGDFRWERGTDGLFIPPADWLPTWPVIGISQHDALAYAAYCESRRTEGPADHVLDLPSYLEWTIAGTAGQPRYYAFGQRFQPRWMKSCFSRPQANPEAVLSYPRDESPVGALDMSGSAFEWSVDWYDEQRGLMRVLGGSWARADPEYFKVQGGVGFNPAISNGETGMRLVLRPREAR